MNQSSPVNRLSNSISIKRVQPPASDATVSVSVSTTRPAPEVKPFFFHSSFPALNTSNRDTSSFHSWRPQIYPSGGKRREEKGMKGKREEKEEKEEKKRDWSSKRIEIIDSR